MEPLQTDEFLPPEERTKKRDFDAVMLAGCSSFVFASFGAFFVGVWPFFIWTRIEQLNFLAIDLAAGLGPAFVFGIIASRRARLAGACGFFAGIMTLGVFLFLRLQQLFVSAQVGQLAPPDYPEIARTAIPVVMTLLAAALAMVALPKGELEFGSNPDEAG